MHMPVIRNTTNIIIHTTQELHTLYKRSMELHPKFHFRKYFYYIVQLIYQLSFFRTYNLLKSKYINICLNIV